MDEKLLVLIWALARAGHFMADSAQASEFAFFLAGLKDTRPAVPEGESDPGVNHFLFQLAAGVYDVTFDWSISRNSVRISIHGERPTTILVADSGDDEPY